MARYLKRGATYEATAPLNSDDPLLSDLENDGSSTPSTSIEGNTQWYSGINDLGAFVTVLSTKNYANDAAAEAGGIALNDYYHTDGVIKKRTV
jgi:hypothetical protein